MKSDPQVKTGLKSAIRLLPIASIPLILTVYLQVFSKSFELSMSGLPISDANGWGTCIKATAEFGAFPANAGEWCMRRPLYSMMAGVILKVIPGFSAVPIVFSILCGLGSVWAYRWIRKLLGWPIAFLVLGLHFAYWFVYAADQTMTESLGLILGIVGFGAMSRAILKPNLIEILSATVWLSLGQLVRPGNILIPFIPMVLGFFNKSRAEEGTKTKERMERILLPLAAILLPNFIAKGVARILNLHNFLNGGNFWGTLYGLSDKNQPWDAAYQLPGVSQAFNDSEVWRIVKEATIANIQSNPNRLITNTFSNIWQMFKYRIPFMSPKSFQLGGFGTLTYFTILILCLLSLFFYVTSRSISLPHKILYLSIVVTSILFYGVDWKSDPYRALSTTQILFFGALCKITLDGTVSTLRKFRKSAPARKVKKTRGEINNSKVTTSSDSVRRFSLVDLARTWPIIVMASSIIVAQIGSPIQSSPSAKSCVDRGGISLVAAGIQTRWIGDIDKPTEFWWSEMIRSLKPGYLIEGLSISSNGELMQRSLYLPSNARLESRKIESACYSYIDPGKDKQNLDAISFRKVLAQ